MTNTTAILNHLIETLKDGQQGFREAAADVEATDLKTLFSEYSLQRSKFSGELQELARSLGADDLATRGSLGGAIHRTWINIKAALSSKDAHAILAECERGEDLAVADYKQALGVEGLPKDVSETLSAQYVEVKAAHDRIRNLRDSLVAK